MKINKIFIFSVFLVGPTYAFSSETITGTKIDPEDAEAQMVTKITRDSSKAEILSFLNVLYKYPEFEVGTPRNEVKNTLVSKNAKIIQSSANRLVIDPDSGQGSIFLVYVFDKEDKFEKQDMMKATRE